MKPLPLDDLPKHSPWARYLLDPTGEPPGDPEAYARVETYDELYARLLADYRADPAPPGEFARRTRERARDDPGAISIGEELVLASPTDLVERERIAVREALAPLVTRKPPRATDGPTVVDLGCGWGASLETVAAAFAGATVVGGEYSTRGVELARELYAGVDGVSVERFDFRGDWDLLARADGDVVVFTQGALTTLDDVRAVVDRFAALAAAGEVVGGVHLEQVDVHPETVLGLLRRRYGRVRGYDGSLLAELERADGLRVADVAYDVVGANPLHPLTRVRWTPG